MLYDIIPPLAFFSSLAGIVFVIARVVARMRREELSHAIQREGARSPHSPDQLLNSGKNKVRLMQSRLSAVGSNIKESLVSLKKTGAPSAASELTRINSKIERPHSTWRDQLSAFSKTASRKISALQSSLSSRLRGLKHTLASRRVAPRVRPGAPAISPVVEKKAPAEFSLRRVEVPPGEPAAVRTETTAQRLQALVRTKRATTSPVQAAQAAVGAGNLNQAEDMLIPYIAKHPKNTAAYLLLADISLARGAWDEGVEILEQVIQLDPSTPGAYAKLGEAALAAGHMTRALEALQRAHDADPGEIAILKNLLKIAQRRDDRVLQKTVIQKMLMLSPGDPEAHLAAEALEARQAEREQTPAA